MQVSSELPTKCVLRLEAIYGSLKRAERSAADLLRTDPGFVQRATISEAADRAGCSQPTFLRLARRLGFSGYADLKASLKSGLPADTLQTVQPAGSAGAQLHHSRDTTIELLNNTLSVLNMQAFDQAATLLRSAKQVCLFSSGSEAMFAQIGAYYLTKIGVHAFSSANADEQLMLLSRMNRDDGDICIVICTMGEQRSEVTVARKAKEHGIPVVAVTAMPYSSLGKIAQVRLQTARLRDDDQSFIDTAPLMLLDGLLRALYTQSNFYRAARALSDELQQESRMMVRGG